MLDQNTDRMWYVIGAIVIGAAIIAMGLNIFSESFDSVDEMMVSLTDVAGDNILSMRDDGVEISLDTSYIEGHNTPLIETDVEYNDRTIYNNKVINPNTFNNIGMRLKVNPHRSVPINSTNPKVNISFYYNIKDFPKKDNSHSLSSYIRVRLDSGVVVKYITPKRFIVNSFDRANHNNWHHYNWTVDLKGNVESIDYFYMWADNAQQGAEVDFTLPIITVY